MSAELRLLEYRLVVPLHLEAATAGRNQLDARVGKRAPDLGRQTGGPWLVASNGAVLDGDRHRSNGPGGSKEDVQRRACRRHEIVVVAFPA